MFLSRKNHPKQFLAWLFLACFVAGTLFSTFHSFSHQNQTSSHQKIITEQDQDDFVKCGLCSLFAAQNQVFSFTCAGLAILFFSQAAAFFFANRFKLSYLLLSNSPRAPPYFS
ncbi:MAG: hypothetical protein K0R25_262 [Rickettsiaceae bacterium]|jgi:hypothetical protein|nr:hypothetical protein [Rickettsiaceae bacterium]